MRLPLWGQALAKEKNGPNKKALLLGW